MVQYFISGIWTSMINGQKVITHVMLHHSDHDNSFKNGKKVRHDDVVKLMKEDDALIYTIEWNYNFREWQKGTQVSFEKVNETTCLVTKKDGKLVSNLSALLPMKVLSAKASAPATLAL